MITYKGDIPPLKPHQSIVHGVNSPQRIEIFYKLADATPNREYFIPYNATTDINGLSPEQLAEWFACRSFTPLNVIFEESFCDLVDKWKLRLNGIKDAFTIDPYQYAETKLDPKYFIQSEAQAQEVVKECGKFLKKGEKEWTKEEVEHFENLCKGYALWVTKNNE